jgi:hypothetical protein
MLDSTGTADSKCWTLQVPVWNPCGTLHCSLFCQSLDFGNTTSFCGCKSTLNHRESSLLAVVLSCASWALALYLILPGEQSPWTNISACFIVHSLHYMFRPWSVAIFRWFATINHALIFVSYGGVLIFNWYMSDRMRTPIIKKKVHETWSHFCIIHSFWCKHMRKKKKLWITSFYFKSEGSSHVNNVNLPSSEYSLFLLSFKDWW